MTALEWLEDKISKKDCGDLPMFVYNAIEQAIEIEKEQHEETFNQSRLAKIFEKDMPPVWESWEQYYKETFKTIKND
jgi:hypothetical protein